MESQSKSIVGATESNHVGVKQRKVGIRMGDLVLRLLALALTLTSAIVLGVDKQTKVVPLQVSPNLPPLNVTLHAKWHYLSAFVYSLVANCIACSYAAISLLLLVMKGSCGKTRLMIMIVDVLMVALVFSGNGAAASVGLMGYKGNSKVRWNKVCNVFERFCNQVAASLALSLAGGLAFLFLVVLATVTLHKKAK